MKRKGWKYYVSSMMLSVIVLVVLIAIIGYFAQPNYIIDGVDWVAYNDSINNRNLEFSKQNPHGFTDRARRFEKDSNVYRIAVLGDSFIWGDGIPYEEVWSHKLENHILAKYDSVEVMHWGRNGWSTKNEFDFYLAEGNKYHPDLLILGFVGNDPDMADYMFEQSKQSWLAKHIPFFAWAERKISDYQYTDIEAILYEEPNISQYKSLLVTFDSLLAEHQTKLLMVITPNSTIDEQKRKFKVVTDILDSVGIEYLNLQPPLINRFGKDVDQSVIDASPVNGHPGIIVTSMFADSTFKWMEDQDHLSHLPLNKEMANQ